MVDVTRDVLADSENETVTIWSTTRPASTFQETKTLLCGRNVVISPAAPDDWIPRVRVRSRATILARRPAPGTL